MSARGCVELGGTCPIHPVAVEADGQARCLTHATDPTRIRRREERNRAGGENRLRTLPKASREPRFRSAAQVRRYAERLAHLVTTGQLAVKLADTAIRAAGLALQVHQLKNQERLTDALLRLEHGGAAVMLLRESLSEGKRRPLPGRIQALPSGDGA